MKLQLPDLGLNDNESFASQPVRTTRDAVNVTFVEARTGRRRLASRPGLSKHISAAITAATKVKRLAALTYDQNRTTYAPETPGSEPTKWSTTTPTKTDCFGVQIDRQGNVYALNGPASIVKYNTDGLLLATLTLPVADPLHSCRALWVDDSDRIYTAVSGGGDQAKVRMWCYRQLANNEFEQLWQLEPGYYVEWMEVKKDILLTAQNRVDRQKAYIVGYKAFSSTVPIESYRKEVSYPLNQARHGTDGSVLICSEPNPTRGFDPAAPDSSPGAQDWTPRLLSNFNQRCWGWWDASHPDAFAITRIPGSDSDEGGAINTWYDISNHGRHWYLSSAPLATSPTLRGTGLGGLPSVHFDGLNNAMESAASTSDEKDHKNEQLTAIPPYKGAQFAVFIVFRTASSDTNVRTLIATVNAAHSGNIRFIATNRAPGNVSVSDPGSVCLYEQAPTAGDAGASTTIPAVPTGIDGYPLPGSMGKDGYTIVTWICDGRVHDVFGSATRSTLRVNGQPCDRWQSATYAPDVGETTWLGRAVATPGMTKFGGDIAEILVLSDWRDTAGVHQRLLTVPEYPDVAWSANSDTECERIEGYLAHKWRMADRLPGGPSAFLLQNAGNVVAGETVSVAGTTYTYAAAIAAGDPANRVLVGTTSKASLLNLAHAMNGTGTAGTHYSSATVPHSTYYALFPITYTNAPNYRLQILARNPNRPPGVDATTEVSAFAWDAPTTSATSFVVSTNNGHYPHPYFWRKTTNTTGGPPRATGAYASPSIPALLNSVYGILAKINPANGDVRWVLTSDYDGSGVGVGGVGYGLAVASDGSVFSTGPRQAVVTGPPAISANAIDVRKITDAGATFSITTGTVAGPWTDDPGAQTYRFPRMAVDRFDNVYVPIFNASVNTTLIGYSKDGTGVVAADCAVEIVTINNLASDPQAHAVAVDRNNPTYQVTTPPNRAQHIVIATQNLGTATVPTVYKVQLVSTTLAAGSNRAMKTFAVMGSDLKEFVPPGTVTTPTGGAGAFDAAARYVDWFAAYGELFFTDGKTYRVYSPLTGAVTEWTSRDDGRIPRGCKLAALWRGRAVLARDPSDPHNWHMAALGNPYSWNQFPITATATQAISGNNARAGTCPDIVNALIPYSDDILIFGGDHSIWMLVGDPMTGILPGDASSAGSFHEVSKVTGIAFGRSWCQDPEGNIYFFGSRGGLWVFKPGSQPQPLTRDTIDQRLTAVDLASYRIGLEWDDLRHGVHIFQFPFGAGGTHVKSWFIEQKSGPWEQEFGTAQLTSLQPTDSLVIDGDLEGDRRMLVGCEDGFVRYFDAASSMGDDGQPIYSHVLLGPYSSDDVETRITALWPVLAKELGSVNWKLFASDTPDDMGTHQAQGAFQPGRNPRIPARARGAYVWIELAVSRAGVPWAIEELMVDATEAGRKRVRRT